MNSNRIKVDGQWLDEFEVANYKRLATHNDEKRDRAARLKCVNKVRADLEKVRDELKSATDLTETHQYGYFKAANALRMLEAILEGKEP